MKAHLPARRLDDWPERLAAFLEERRHIPYAWGKQDCFLMAMDAALAMTGQDRAAPWREYMTGEDEVRGVIAGAGGIPELMEAVEAIFGVMRVGPLLAQRGDLALITEGDVEALGVVTGLHVAVAGLRGLVFYPATVARMAWVT